MNQGQGANTPLEPGDGGAAPVGDGDYVVKPGDGMGSIAFAHGHFWKTLWELPANADLKRARKHPHILLPGDRVTILPLRRRDEPCATGARHVFRRKGVPAQVRFVMRDVEGKPFAGKRYELTLGRTRTSGQTDGEGRIEAWVDPAERAGELTVWLDTPGYPELVRHPLRIGELLPPASLRGAKARLEALGYAAGRGDPPGDAPSDALRAAIASFQSASGLEATGDYDAATRDALYAAYGS